MRTISLDILASLMNTSKNKLNEYYKDVMNDGCISMKYINDEIIDQYVKNVLLNDRCFDINLYKLNDENIKRHFNEIKMLKDYQHLKILYGFTKNVTNIYKEFSNRYYISLRTIERKYKQVMNSSSLSKLLLNENEINYLSDNRYTCCLLAKNYIIDRHSNSSLLKNQRIYDDLKQMTDYPCENCPFKKGEYISKTLRTIQCKRNSESIIIPNTRYVVDDIIRKIPKQEEELAIHGEKKWASKYRHTVIRNRPELVNEVWVSDHHKFDLMVITKINKDNTFETGRIYITGILDIASYALVGYAISTNPNANTIVETFIRSVTFKKDNNYCGLPLVFYIDNGKDYRANKLKGLNKSEQESIIQFNRDFINSGLLDYFNIRVINALPYRGCSKVIEGTWKIIEENYIKGMPGYVGNCIQNRPVDVQKDIKEGKLYTFEQFVDIFAEQIYPAYNNLISKETGLSPNDLYNSLKKADTIVPSWASLAVLRGKKETRDIRQKQVSYDNKKYWHAGLAKHIGKKVELFAFDNPYNRTISLVVDKQYVGEGHLIEKLDMVEKEVIKVKNHLLEQSNQYKTISSHIDEIHDIVLASDILSKDNKIPAIINRFYVQSRDIEKDKKESIDDKNIPRELKIDALKYMEDITEEENEEKDIFQECFEHYGE